MNLGVEGNKEGSSYDQTFIIWKEESPDTVKHARTEAEPLHNVIKKTTSKAPVHVAMVAQTVELCVYCGKEHIFDQCHSNPTLIFYTRNQISKKKKQKKQPVLKYLQPKIKKPPKY